MASIVVQYLCSVVNHEVDGGCRGKYRGSVSAGGWVVNCNEG